VLVAVVGQDPPPVRDYVPNVPAGLQLILDRALRKHRDDRYESGAQVHSDLLQLRAEVAPYEGASRTSPISGSRRTAAGAGGVIGKIARHRARAGAVTAIVLIVVAAASFGWYRLKNSGASSSSRRLSELRFTKIMTASRAGGLISPDGKYLGY